VRWSSLGDLLCVHSAYPTDATDAVFFGPDTYRFAQLIGLFLRAGNHSVRRAVDIGCGSGAGALLIARAFPQAQVLAVDINRQALRFTAVNAKLAGTTNLKSIPSNLLHDVEGDFDLIIANPPYMMDAQERAYRHGGGELGADLSVKILETALSRLAPRGTLVLYTGVAMIEGYDPFLEILKQRLSGQSCSWHYWEMDPDVFSEELLKPAYAEVERIAAVALTVERTE
jgi:methylase of polypeptide subunit release factors